LILQLENELDLDISSHVGIIIFTFMLWISAFLQKKFCETQLSKLRFSTISTKVMVRRHQERDGESMLEVLDIPSEELVVGDIIRIAKGRVVPADCILLELDDDTEPMELNAKNLSPNSDAAEIIEAFPIPKPRRLTET